MIYISSACVKAATIKESVEQLYKAGYQNIELSGGTNPYNGLEEDLVALKEKYNLNLICHNYFPPPPVPFVLNLASLNEDVRRMSYEHLLRSLALSERLEASIFAFHAGFAIDIPVSQVGKNLSELKLFDRTTALNTFTEQAQRLFDQDFKVKIYIENNVLSSANKKTYHPTNPLFFTDLSGYQEINNKMPFVPLLDVAHLKVSCRSLGLDFEKELATLWQMTDYIHISDNDGLFDTNQHLSQDAELFHQLNRLDFTGKVVTLEVYNGLERVEESYRAVEQLINNSK